MGRRRVLVFTFPPTHPNCGLRAGERVRQDNRVTYAVDEVAPDVFFARGADANWVLLRDGRDVTLIDTGYPGYLADVLHSIRSIGSDPKYVAAVLITHAHVDHVGGANYFAESFGTPVYTDATEARHARREFVEQATSWEIAKNLRPGMAPWLARVMRVGVLKKVAVSTAGAFPSGGELDVPGRPVPVPTHGHTSGHTAYHLPTVKAVATGDELVSGHALLRNAGPSLLPGFFSHGDVRESVGRLSGLNAELILPGHGAPLRQPIALAVADALRR